MKKLIGNLSEIIKTEKFEIINYLFITALLFGTCFFEFFAWIVLVHVILLSLFFDYNKLLKLIVYLITFKLCLNVKLGNSQINLKNISIFVLMFSIVIRFLIQLLKKQKKITFRVFIPTLVFTMYLGLLSLRGFRLIILLDFLMIVFSFYFLYEIREDLKLEEIIIFLCLGTIISTTFSLSYFFSPRLGNLLTKGSFYGVMKIAGMLSNTNHWVLYGGVCICGLLYLKVNKRVSNTKFFILFIPLLVFGIYTISRNFAISLVVSCLLFIAFYYIKYRKDALKFIGHLILSIIIVCLICFNPTKATLVRLGILSKTIYGIETPSEEPTFDPTDEENEAFNKLIFEGLVEFDPGRVGIWKLYITKITGTPLNTLIGVGLDSPDIGQRVAHNFFLQIIYYVGILGLLLLLWLLFALINWKEIKTINRLYTKLIYIGVCGFMMMVESCLGNFAMFILLTLILVDDKVVKHETEIVTVNMEEKLLLEHEGEISGE